MRDMAWLQGFRLSGKLLIVLTLLLIVAQTLFSVVFYHREQLRLIQQHDARLLRAVETISRAVAVDVWNFNPDTIELVISPYLVDPAVRWLYFKDTQGNAMRFFMGEGGVIERASDVPPLSMDEHMLPADISVTLAGSLQTVGALQLGASRLYIQNQLNDQIRRQLFELLLLNILLAAALMVSMSRMVLTPLRKLNQALGIAIHSKDGVLDNPLVGLRDEFEDVAQNVSLLSARLADDVQRVRAAEQQAIAEKQRAESTLQRLHQTQDALLQSEKLASLGSMVVGVAHEINTPVGAVVTSSSHALSLLHDVRNDVELGRLSKQRLVSTLDELQEAVSLSLNNAERAANLIENFKLVAADQPQTAAIEFDLSNLLLHHIEQCRGEPKYRQLSFSSEILPSVRFRGNPELFTLLLQQLLSNVVQHAYDQGQHGWCRLTLRLETEQLVLSCSDGGHGMSEQVRRKIFDPFFTTTLGQGSNGLGLAIVYRIVHVNLAGNIQVESELTQGTRIEIRFPWHQQDMALREVANQSHNIDQPPS